MQFLPVFLSVRSQPCLVVGGGDVATRKVELLLKAQALVTVISPVLGTALKTLHEAGKFTHRAESFRAEQVDGQRVIIAATDDEVVNRAVAMAAQASNIPVNVVDRPELCTFIMPAIIDRSPVIVAVSSGGASPVLARLLRARLESLVPAAYGRLATLVSSFRDKVKARFASGADRRVFWERVLQGAVAEMAYAGRDDEARAALEKQLASTQAGIAQGEVYLVGAGPGDPDLLTFRALRLMQQADVVVYDRLVSKQVLELVRRDAEKLYAGKERDNHAIPQEDINQLLVRLAKEGKRVLRLKGGDPFIFGRGGEEIATLAAEGIPFQVVPGITAAAGCAAYSGIPLTHRDYSQAVVFVTGHLQDGSVNLNWKALAQPNQTVVFYMGLHGVPAICAGLTSHGMPNTTPVALIQQGTTPNQRVFVSTLEGLPELVNKEKIKAPTLIIVGEVVRLHETLSWFLPQLP